MFKATFASADKRFDVAFDKENTLNVDFSNRMVEKVKEPWDKYEGEYSVIPSIDQQILQTKDLLMKDDVTIEQIPHYEVSNDKGETFIIGDGDLKI